MSRKVRLYSVENISVKGVIHTTVAFWFHRIDTRNNFQKILQKFEAKKLLEERIPIYLKKTKQKQNKMHQVPLFT